MKLRSVLVVLLVLAAASVCVRLGFWQLSRWHEKRALNRALARALAAPPRELGAKPHPEADVLGLRIEARGRYDESRQVLLGARPHMGEPGVEVVTPLLLEGGSSAVLVNRGWLYAADAATARPQESPEPGPVASRVRLFTSSSGSRNVALLPTTKSATGTSRAADGPTRVTLASLTSRAGRRSAAGDALTTFPPTVPMFWVWRPPTVAAASARER